MINKYLLLEKEIEEINKVNNIISLVTWDIAVNMPIGSIESRSNEISFIRSITCSRLKSNKINDLISAAEGEVKYLDSWQLANLREIKKLVKITNCIEDGLYERYVAASIKSELIWRKARAENDFNLLAPYLEDILICIREIASAKADVIACSKYDALIDEYDPDRKSSEIKNIFKVLKNNLPEIIRTIADKQKSRSVLKIKPVSIKQQRLIAKKIMEAMGFDFVHGRLDESTHPFCGGTPFDVRITNRYSSKDFLSGVMNIVHETGHAL